MSVALISAVANAANLVVDKIALSRQRIALHVFLPILFIFLFGFTLILVPFFGQIVWEAAVLPNSLFLLLIMIVIAISWNVFFYQSVQKEKVHQHELLMMVAPLITMILAALFFPQEYNAKVFILGLVASGALLIAKIERSHLVFDQTDYNLILAVVLMSVENIIIRELLYSYSPVALYAVRTFFVAGFFMAYYRPRYNRVSTGHWWLIAFSAGIGVTQMLTRFYAFDSLGLIYTSLVSLLAPVIVFDASWEILHERIRARVIIASLIIMICVVLATLINFGTG